MLSRNFLNDGGSVHCCFFGFGNLYTRKNFFMYSRYSAIFVLIIAFIFHTRYLEHFNILPIRYLIMFESLMLNFRWVS